ncbi:MAG: hypothetical protein JXM70_22190, partial [Pirellulales bacterium]|nr:hypothetical protein [Pirellulales bacterium]
VPSWSAPLSNLNMAAWGEHTVGTASTAAGAGVLYPSGLVGSQTLADFSVVQNAENMGEIINDFDPNTPGIYDFKLTAFAPNLNPTADDKLIVWMQVDTSMVPEPTSILIFTLLPVFSIVLGWRQWRKA